MVAHAHTHTHTHTHTHHPPYDFEYETVLLLLHDDRKKMPSESTYILTEYQQFALKIGRLR